MACLSPYSEVAEIGCIQVFTAIQPFEVARKSCPPGTDFIPSLTATKYQILADYLMASKFKITFHFRNMGYIRRFMI